MVNQLKNNAKVKICSQVVPPIVERQAETVTV